jgi:hypothetical protein
MSHVAIVDAYAGFISEVELGDQSEQCALAAAGMT